MDLDGRPLLGRGRLRGRPRGRAQHLRRGGTGQGQVGAFEMRFLIHATFRFFFSLDL